jgi:putative aldouronate transport system substrate-binding protein
MKRFIVLLTSLCLLISIIAGCNTSGGTNESTTASENDNETTSATTSSAEKVSMELFYKPWVAIPIEGNDEYLKWINQTSGADWKFTYATDFEAEILTRAASNSLPDLMMIDSYVTLFKLYDEGILLDDWYPYEERMPDTFKNISDLQKQYFSVNGKLTCVPTLGGEQWYSFEIRKDWLTELNLKMPTTIDEFLDVARAFTFNDPDKNGKNDTYGISGATLTGTGSMGEVLQLQNFWSSYKVDDIKSGFYITKDNKVSNNIIDGNLKKCLDLIKTIIDEKIIDPDWYSVGLAQRQPGMYQGKYGILFRMPPEYLLSETDQARSLDGLVKDWWSIMPPIDANGDGTGGKLPPWTPFGGIRTVTAECGKSAAKMDAVVKLLEATAFPNEGYFIMRAGVGINGRVLKAFGDRWYIDMLHNTLGSKYNTSIGLANYGKYINSYNPLANIIFGQHPYPDAVTMESLDMSDQVSKLPTYDNSYHYLLRLDTEALANATSDAEEFMINYVLGKDPDYNAFVTKWLKDAGQALLDQAEQQLKDYGYIK